MADTALTIITGSLQEIFVYSPGETVDDSDAELGLDLINQMLEHWSAAYSLAAFCILEQSFTMTPGKFKYSIGTSGTPDIVATRPIRLIEGPGMAYVQDNNNQKYQVDVIGRDQYNMIGYPLATSDVPSRIFYDPQFPNGVLNINPVPSQAYQMFFDSYQQLGSLASLSTAFTFPPGYKPAIQSNLAVWMGPFFKGAVISADVKKRARDTLKGIKRANRRTPVGFLDAYIVSRARPTYNIKTDSRGA